MASSQPRSEPLDFCVWCMLKDKVYTTALTTLEELKQRISEELSKFTRAICKKIFGNLFNCCQNWKEANDRYFQHML